MLSFTLAYYVCVMTGTIKNPKYETCFIDRMITSEPLNKEQCEAIALELKISPKILPR